MTRPALSMILALGTNGALGYHGKLPWICPEDRAHFFRTTRGHAIIMGRRTWEEEGAALPERINIVVSRSLPKAGTPDRHVVRSLADAIALARTVDPEPFVIGGAQLFHEAVPLVTRVYLTEIPDTPDADVFFTFDRAPFKVTHERVGEDGVRFVVLERSDSVRAPLP